MISTPTPRKTPTREQAELADRYRGCLLGGAVGDALGAPVEFLDLKQIRSRFGAGGIRDYAKAFGQLGAITDDTQMTLFTAEGLLRAWVRMDQRGIVPSFESVTGHAYLRWLHTQGGTPQLVSRNQADIDGWLVSHRELHARRVPGNTCLSALEATKGFGTPAVNDSKGCGGLMRTAPVALFIHSARRGELADQECFDMACSLAALTHGHPSGQLPAGVFSLVLLRVLQGDGLRLAIRTAKEHLRRVPRHEETLAAIEDAERMASIDMPVDRAIADLGGGWVAEEALAIALYCALTAGSLEEGVIAAVNHDGDSDSTGAIAGNLLGVKYGEASIPKRWLDGLELRGVIAEVAEDLLMYPEWKTDDSDEGRFYFERYPGN